MFNTRGGTIITKSARAVIAAGKTFCSSYSIHNPNDMANMATARRFMDDYMRRIESGEKKEEDDKKKDCAGNFKCEITRRYKRGGEVDCKCKLVCMAKISETMMIHEEAKREEKENI
uniref:Uncharacterized protein n=1 Tax=viral metagenome TaxID=1070528 RepID=A0A6C0I4F1_9ZZZZ